MTLWQMWNSGDSKKISDCQSLEVGWDREMDRQSIFRVVNVPCNTIRMDTYHYTFEQIYRRYNTENSTVSLGEEKKKNVSFFSIKACQPHSPSTSNESTTGAQQATDTSALGEGRGPIWAFGLCFHNGSSPLLQSHSFLLNYQCLFNFTYTAKFIWP